LENNVAGIHLYTLNKSRSTTVITRRLNELGWFVRKKATAVKSVTA
jgi:hypothetical protein